ALERLQAVQQLEDIAACYGVGHDAIFFDLGGDQAESLAILDDCFSPDVQSQFVFFGGEPVPLDGLPALVSFVEGFAIDTGYHSARNTPGNVRVELIDEDNAVVTTAGATPHFSLASAEAPFIDLITARYTHIAHRDEDGRWRTTSFEIEVDEVARVDASFALGQ
ncbi:MAG: hypothetical protein KC431_27855, partial [Myxococcales bacterium]|nr:hypothetical protein [Myxococcales bacterium]